MNEVLKLLEDNARLSADQLAMMLDKESGDIRDMIEKTGRDILIEVDGGVKVDNARRVIEAGADVLVMGTGIFVAEDPAAVVRTICSEEAGT